MAKLDVATIHGVVLSVITWLLTLGEWMRTLWRHLVVVREHLYHIIYSCLVWIFPRKTYRLQKIPRHLAVIFPNEVPNMPKTVLDLAYFCMVYGIEELTVYDPLCMLKDCKNELAHGLESKRPPRAVFAIDGRRYAADKTDRSVVYRTEPEFSMNFLHADGRASFLGALRELAEDVKCGRRVATELKTDDISKKLSEKKITEPDFLLKFGQGNSIFGYPPWALRVTEVLEVESKGGLSELQFVECLEVFSKRDQRFGK